MWFSNAFGTLEVKNVLLQNSSSKNPGNGLTLNRQQAITCTYDDKAAMNSLTNKVLNSDANKFSLLCRQIEA